MLFSQKKARKLTKCDVSDRRSQVSQMLAHQLTCVQHDKTTVCSQFWLLFTLKKFVKHKSRWLQSILE